MVYIYIDRLMSYSDCSATNKIEEKQSKKIILKRICVCGGGGRMGLLKSKSSQVMIIKFNTN